MQNIVDFSKLDAQSLTITITGYLIVFLALVLLYVAFVSLPKILNLILNTPKPQKAKTEGEEAEKPARLTGEVNAAISTAIFLYFNELHDDEDPIITIEKISKTYSPWSSKIYSVHHKNLPNYNLPSV